MIDYKLGVSFFRTAQGSEPVLDWLKRLRAVDRKMIGEDIKTVQLGWPIGMPVVRKMDKALWEVRSKLTDGIARVLFTVKRDRMVLLHGFIKKTGKTPERELKTARTRLKLVAGKE